MLNMQDGPQFKVNIVMLSGTKRMLDVSPSTTVLSIMEQLQELTGAALLLSIFCFMLRWLHTRGGCASRFIVKCARTGKH